MEKINQLTDIDVIKIEVGNILTIADPQFDLTSPIEAKDNVEDCLRLLSILRTFVRSLKHDCEASRRETQFLTKLLSL